MKTYRERAQEIESRAKAARHKRDVYTLGGILLSVAALCAAFVLAFNLVLFVPYATGGAPDLSAYRKSEYYPVIAKLADGLYDPPVRANNFERWGLWNVFSAAGKGAADFDGMTGDLPPASAGEESAGYREVTDLQTEGVTEGDLFKRTADTLFYFGYRPQREEVVVTEIEKEGEVSYEKTTVLIPGALVLSAYSIRGGESELISSLEIVPGGSIKGYEGQREMFLTQDGGRALLLLPCLREGRKYTAVITVNTEDPHTMSVVSEQYLSGSYVTSRIVGGVLLTVSNFAVSRNADFAEEADFLPQFGSTGEMKSLPVEKIYLPESATRAEYTVLASFDTLDGTPIDAEALLSFSDEVYFAAADLYATNGFSEQRTAKSADGTREAAYSADVTELTRVHFEGGMFEVTASKVVDGSVNDRYSMDEYDGYFRVAVTVSAEPVLDMDGDGAPMPAKTASVNASLYVLNAATMELVSSAERFAPEGESVYSARFDGTVAYICTARAMQYVITDPVFAFDLTDPMHITSKDTGTIDGYSFALTKFKDGTLLGIGTGSVWQDTLKLDVYAETEDAVELVCTFEESGFYSEVRKAYFVDREQGLIGFLFYSYDQQSEHNGPCYVLLRYDGYTFTELLRKDFSGACDETRAFFADGWLYVVSNDDFFTFSF